MKRGGRGRVLVPGVCVAVLLALPFAARPRKTTPVGQVAPSETLVVLTPHNEAIRAEMGHGFIRHMAARGRRVEIDWRSPGGAAEITRYLAAEYTAAFKLHWTRTLGQRWSGKIEAAISSPGGNPSDPEVASARRAFLTSNVGCGVDVLFGSGSIEFARHAEAGRLVDSGILQRHPELFGDNGIPREAGGEIYWDAEGRWVGACLARFGVCSNMDVLARLGFHEPPSSWAELAHPALHGRLALADPTKSGSVGKAFEMLVQNQMNEAWDLLGGPRSSPASTDPKAVSDGRGGDGDPAGTATAAALDAGERERRAQRDGWARAIRLIRRIAGNGRYFTDNASKIARDVAAGDAAAGMCIDFYGRIPDAESDAARAGRSDLPPSSPADRLVFRSARAGTSLGADPIGLLRGAPHRELAIAFIDFVLSDEGQKLWALRRGTPGGPVHHTLGRLPISPRLNRPELDAHRFEPQEDLRAAAQRFRYRPGWTGPLFGAIAFVVKATCVDAERELQEAYGALAAAGFPAAATDAFDDLTLVDFDTVSGPLREALRSPDPLASAKWAVHIAQQARRQYRLAAKLARATRGGGR